MCKENFLKTATQPLVTVITPTYNRARFIIDTVSSVLGQSYKDIEYIVIDDGSSDNTKQLLAPFCNRIIYIYHENMGENKTVNKAYHLARGEYIIVVNSDDPLCDLQAIHTLASALSDHPEALAVYPDWMRIDEYGAPLGAILQQKFTISSMLRHFNVTLGPGMMIRRKALEQIGFRNESLRYTGDIDVSFRLALRGQLIHVPKVLATHREHGEMLTTTGNQQLMKEEVARLAEEAFKSPLLPEELMRDKDAILASVYRKCNLYGRILLFGDNDLWGNKFNGHNLHLYLQETGRNASHLVHNKKSSDLTTFVHSKDPCDTYHQRLICNNLFLEADVFHIHLLHNTYFDINYLPLLSSLKPVVWTLHDPWALSGHCVHHYDCTKWKTHCHDCPYLDAPFAIPYDISAYEFEIKRKAIQNSCIHVIVASSWMENKVKQSPIWAGKTIHKVPFGINQELFAPQSIVDAKRAMGVDPFDTVLFARTQASFKGIEVLREALAVLPPERNYTLFTVGERDLLPSLAPNIKHKEFGWLDDENKLLQLYQACDLLLMPSEQEAFGMMAIEAMSCGKMVLALDVDTSALPETINAPHCGIAVAREGYAGELQRLLVNPEEVVRRGELSLAYARENYSHTHYVRQILRVYDATIKDFEKTESAHLVIEQLKKYATQPPVFFQSKACPQRYDYKFTLVDWYRKGKMYYLEHGALATANKIMRKLISKTKLFA